MKKVLKFLGLLLLLLVALAAVAWFKFCPKPGVDEALTFPVDSEYVGWIGKPADLDFTSLDGRKVSSAELRGKVLLLDFWATWCGPCLQSLDHLKTIREKFQTQGLEVVAINFDEDRVAVENVVKSRGLPWPQYFEGRDNSLGRRFGITHYPSVWLVDKVGNVRYISALTDTENKIAVLLAETDAQAAEFGKNAGSGYLGRLNAGLATMRKLKTSDLVGTVTARAKSISADAVTSTSPASVSGLSSSLKLRSIMASSKPSAVIQAGEASRYLSIGDTLRVQTTQGEVQLRVEKIETTGVTLIDAASGERVRLSPK